MGVSHLVRRYLKTQLFQARKPEAIESVDLENLTVFTCEQIAQIRQMFTDGKNDEAWQMIDDIINERVNKKL